MGGVLHLHTRGSDLVAGTRRLRMPWAIHARGLPAADAGAVRLLRLVLGLDVPRVPQRIHQLAAGVHTGAPLATALALALTTLALTVAPCRCPHQSLSAEGKLCVVLVLCNLLLVLCVMVELRAWAFGHGHCGVCLQLGLALLVEAAIGGTTIAWVSMSTTLHTQTHRARTYSHTHPSCPAPPPSPPPHPHPNPPYTSSGARVAAGARRPHRPTAAELRGRYLAALTRGAACLQSRSCDRLCILWMWESNNRRDSTFGVHYPLVATNGAGSAVVGLKYIREQCPQGLQRHVPHHTVLQPRRLANAKTAPVKTAPVTAREKTIWAQCLR